jgi:ribulose 1,5-bisphosphate synthetase/thiazole synthase
MMNKKMITLLVAGWMGLTGCSTVKSNALDVGVTHSNQVRITNVSVEQDAGEIYVSGNLRMASAATTRTGHVDVNFIGADGAVLQTEHVVPSSKLFLRSSRMSPSFSVKAEVEGVTEIQVVHHPDTMNECEL